MMDTVVNFLYAAILSGTPLLFGTVGEITTQKAGNLNLGVEGMMWLGAFAGFFAAHKTDSPLFAVLAAFAAAAFGALIYAFLTVTLKANQNVTGLTLTTFGIGLSLAMSFSMTNKAGGAPKLSAGFIASLDTVRIPFLSDIPYIGKLLFSLNPLVYLGVFIAVAGALYLKHTRPGLSLRAVGENPYSADAAGINVTVMKYLHIVAGGGICGIGGAYMSLVTANGSWQPGGIVNGMGWIAVALVIFASWSPSKAILGSFIFGAFNSLNNYIPARVIEIPNAFWQMLPFVLTTVVLIVTSVRKSRENAQPAGCGVNYFREER